MITQTKLKEILHYEPLTGIWTWLKPVAKIVKKGDKAGSLCKYSKYINIKIQYNTYRAHRLAYLYMTGNIPEQIDHKDGIRHNNKWLNLKPANFDINAKNKALYKSSTSGITGVRYRKKDKIWVANIGLNKKRMHLGSFKNKQDAINARLAANKKYGFSTRHGT